MSKLKVAIISTADWAGSQYHACQAINSVGEFECRHVTMFNHPFEFPTDIFVSIYPNLKGERLTESVRASKDSQYSAACQALGESDVIHLWNTYPGDEKLMVAGLPIDFRKVKVATMTGSLYRDNFGKDSQHHRFINQQIAGLGNCRLTVQNPMLRFPDEIDSTFIPHAMDTDSLKPKKNRKKAVGIYKPINVESSKSSDEELNLLRGVLKNHSDWSIDLDYSMSWKERMVRLSECSLFVQDIKPYIEYWGRSTLEACALGIPVMQNYNGDVLKYINSEGKLGNPQVVGVDCKSFESTLTKLIQGEDYRKDVGCCSRNWVKSHFSYSVVGKMYSEIYRKAL